MLTISIEPADTKATMAHNLRIIADLIDEGNNDGRFPDWSLDGREKKEKLIEITLFNIYSRIGIHRPANHEDILEFCLDDLGGEENEDWSDADVQRAFGKFIERKMGYGSL
jgi:hypothetical protein